MGLPLVLATSNGNSGADVTATSITLPAGSGGGLLVIFGKDGSAAPTSITGTGWSLLVGGSSGGAVWGGVYFKVADGNDSLTINHVAEGTAYAAYRLSGYDFAITPGAATPATGTNTAPNPPSLDPAGWGSDPARWIAAYVWDVGSTTHTAYPSGYTASQVTDQWSNTSGVGVAAATRETAASVEDPAAGTIGSSRAWVAFTVAVRALGTFDTGIFDINTFDSLAGPITGTLNALGTGSDTFATTGGKVAVNGTLNATGGGPDVSTVSGQVKVEGTLNATEAGSDVAEFSGLVAYSGVAGSMNAVETGAGTFAGSGTVAISGSMNVQNVGSDTLAASAQTKVTGSMNVQNVGSDTLAGSGTLMVQGYLQGVGTGLDTLATTGGAVAVSGSMDTSGEGQDFFDGTGLVGYTGISGSMSAFDPGPDLAAFVATNPVQGSFASAEAGPDVASIAGTLPISGTFDKTEAGSDTIAVSGTLPISGTFAQTEAGSDLSYMYGVVNYTGISGVMDAQGGGVDTFAASGSLSWPTRTGSLDATEAASDTLAATGSLGWWGPTLLYVIYPSGLAAPSAAQIRQGKDSTGSAAVAAGYQADPLTGGEFTFPTATGLQPNTWYRVSFVWSDGVSDSDVVTSDPFQTMNAITGTMLAQESGSDPMVVYGLVAVRGLLLTQEPFGDTFAGRSRAEGTMNAIEPTSDTATGAGGVAVRGTMAAQASGSDTAEGVMLLVASGVLDATETGSDTAFFYMGQVSTGYMDAWEGAVEDTFSGTAYIRQILSVVQMVVYPTVNDADPAVEDDSANVPAPATRQKYLQVAATSRRITIS